MFHFSCKAVSLLPSLSLLPSPRWAASALSRVRHCPAELSCRCCGGDVPQPSHISSTSAFPRLMLLLLHVALISPHSVRGTAEGRGKEERRKY